MNTAAPPWPHHLPEARLFFPLPQLSGVLGRLLKQLTRGVPLRLGPRPPLDVRNRWDIERLGIVRF